MVTFSPVLDPSKQAKWRVASQIVVKVDVVQVLHSDPTEYGSRFLHVARASTY